MKYTHILWDFNGTLLDDVGTGIVSINALLSSRGLRTLGGVEEYHEVFGFPIIDYYKRLGFDFDAEPYDKIAHEWVKLYLHHVKEAPLFEGALDVLDTIKESGVPQIILSATEKEMLEGQLSSLGIRGYFSEVLGLDNVYAHGKIDIGKEWMERTRPERALLIGDTEHDFEVARAIGAECVLVACGHRPRKALESCGTTVVGNIKEIVKIL